MTTHSPVVVRELSGNQLFVVRGTAEQHAALPAGMADDIQSTMRLYPDAFLAASVCVCEGASEVGLVRGLDQFRSGNGELSAWACGVALIDCGGGDPDRCLARASVFHALGYRVAILRDDDQKPDAALEAAFQGDGGKVVVAERRTLEDELFASLRRMPSRSSLIVPASCTARPHKRAYKVGLGRRNRLGGGKKRNHARTAQQSSAKPRAHERRAGSNP